MAGLKPARLSDREGLRAAYARVLAAKAEIIVEIKTMEYGGKAFTVRDPEGYLWSVGEYSPWAEKETITA